MFGSERDDGGVHTTGHSSCTWSRTNPMPCSKAVAAGGTVVRAMVDQDYGGRGGTVADPEGNHWSIGSDQPAWGLPAAGGTTGAACGDATVNGGCRLSVSLVLAGERRDQLVDQQCCVLAPLRGIRSIREDAPNVLVPHHLDQPVSFLGRRILGLEDRTRATMDHAQQ